MPSDSNVVSCGAHKMLTAHSGGHMFASQVNERLGISLTDPRFINYLCTMDIYVRMQSCDPTINERIGISMTNA